MGNGKSEGILCPQNEDDFLEMKWIPFSGQAGGEWWLHCPTWGVLALYCCMAIRDRTPSGRVRSKAPGDPLIEVDRRWRGRCAAGAAGRDYGGESTTATSGVLLANGKAVPGGLSPLRASGQ